MVVCITIVVVFPMLLIIVRGPETALSSIILVAVSLSQINSVIVGGTASKRFGLFLACLVAVSCIWSIVEKLEPEDDVRRRPILLVEFPLEEYVDLARLCLKISPKNLHLMFEYCLI